LRVRDVRDAEREAEKIVKVRAKSTYGISPILVRVESSDLDDTSSIPNYVIRGTATIIVEPNDC